MGLTLQDQMTSTSLQPDSAAFGLRTGDTVSGKIRPPKEQSTLFRFIKSGLD